MKRIFGTFALFLAVYAATPALAAGGKDYLPGKPCPAVGLAKLTEARDDMLLCLEAADGELVWKSMVSAPPPPPASIPAGTVAFFVTPICPVGWVLADGGPSGMWPALAAMVGPKLPDLRGEFIRGLDAGRGVDKGRLMASSQKQETEKLYALAADKGRGVLGFSQIEAPGWSGNRLLDSFEIKPRDNASSFGIGVEPLGKGETRPRNVALLPCIATGQ